MLHSYNSLHPTYAAAAFFRLFVTLTTWICFSTIVARVPQRERGKAQTVSKKHNADPFFTLYPVTLPFLVGQLVTGMWQRIVAYRATPLTNEIVRNGRIA